MKLSKKELLEIIKVEEMPIEVEKYIELKDVYNKTFSGNSSIFNIKDDRIYLKVANYGELEIESENTRYFNKKDLAGEVIDFIQDEERDYLIVREIEGENGISESYIKNPKKLAKYFGEHLRMIHSMEKSGCPTRDITNDIVKKCYKNVEENKLNMEQFFTEHGFTPYQGLLMLDSLYDSYSNDVFIHGDYCLPNIIMKNYAYSGIVDLDCSGIGDRHYDICCGLWSLNYNLKSKEYGEIFLDAYGRDAIDKDRLAFNKLLHILS